jgi:hypothetical protein
MFEVEDEVALHILGKLQRVNDEPSQLAIIASVFALCLEHMLEHVDHPALRTPGEALLHSITRHMASIDAAVSAARANGIGN